MDSNDLSALGSDNLYNGNLSVDDIRRRAPAVFATGAHHQLSAKYTFIPTERVLSALTGAGLVPVEARQTRTRSRSVEHARHVIRLRRRYETVRLRDAIPEVLFLNSHDGTSAYQLRVAVFRVVCENGLIVSRGVMPGVFVPHRGDIVDQVVVGALQIAERFDALGAQVERMEHRILSRGEQIDFAERALRLRFPDLNESGMQPSHLLTCRRVEDTADDLWSVLNKVQENLIRGGLSKRAATGRLTRTRAITSIREDVRLNSGLWDLATEALAA